MPTKWIFTRNGKKTGIYSRLGTHSCKVGLLTNSENPGLLPPEGSIWNSWTTTCKQQTQQQSQWYKSNKSIHFIQVSTDKYFSLLNQEKKEFLATSIPNGTASISKLQGWHSILLPELAILLICSSFKTPTIIIALALEVDKSKLPISTKHAYPIKINGETLFSSRRYSRTHYQIICLERIKGPMTNDL